MPPTFAAQTLCIVFAAAIVTGADAAFCTSGVRPYANHGARGAGAPAAAAHATRIITTTAGVTRPVVRSRDIRGTVRGEVPLPRR